ncbi:MAG: hypothetical protein QJR00_04785 [Bacillota bacterium]|nr:hypothetical protein [Bacillota bacterium]
MVVSLQAIGYMLVRPAVSYRIIAEKRPLFWPFVITTLPGLAVIPFYIQGFQPVIPSELQAEILGPGDQVPFLVGGIAAGAIWGSLLIMLLQAGLAAFFLTFWSHKVPFTTLFSLTIVSSSPYLLRVLVGVLLLNLGLIDYYSYETATSLAGFLGLTPATTRSFLYVLLVSVDAVALWTLALFTGGLGSIGKVSLAARGTIAGLLWLLIVVMPRWFSFHSDGAPLLFH